MTALGKLAQGMRTFVSDVAQGFFEITHNGFAVVGLAVVFSALTLLARPDLRQAGESQLVSWLHARQAEALGVVPELDAIDRATAVTLIVWVSRLCTTPLVVPVVTTWVTSASRENDWENRIRSRSVRNSDSPGAYGRSDSGRLLARRGSMQSKL